MGSGMPAVACRASEGSGSRGLSVVMPAGHALAYARASDVVGEFGMVCGWGGMPARPGGAVMVGGGRGMCGDLGLGTRLLTRAPLMGVPLMVDVKKPRIAPGLLCWCGATSD